MKTKNQTTTNPMSLKAIINTATLQNWSDVKLIIMMALGFSCEDLLYITFKQATLLEKLAKANLLRKEVLLVYIKTTSKKQLAEEKKLMLKLIKEFNNPQKTKPVKLVLHPGQREPRIFSFANNPLPRHTIGQLDLRLGKPKDPIWKAYCNNVNLSRAFLALSLMEQGMQNPESKKEN